MERIKTFLLDLLHFGSMVTWILISDFGDLYKLLGLLLFIVVTFIWAYNSKTADKIIGYIGEMFEESANEMYGEEE